MSALAIAKEIGREAVLEKISAAGLVEYGLEAEPLAERIGKAKGNKAVCGLNNVDVDKVLLALLREAPEKVLEGFSAAAFAAGAEEMTLSLPQSEEKLAGELAETAGKYGVVIENDIINVREAEEKEELVLHIASAADVADVLEGTYEAGVYVCADGTSVKKVPADTKLSDLVSLDGAKAVRLGCRYYTAEEAVQLTAADAKNGSIQVLGEKNCIVHETLEKLSAYRQVSCGKCVFCREGLIQLEYMQKEITAARGKTDYSALTEEIGTAMCGNTLCSIGQESAKTALDAMAKFGDEYTAHIKKNKCPAQVCSSFVHIYIDPQTCTGCGDCLDVCPKDCIEGKAKFIHMIDEFDCTKCGKCIEACEEDAIIQTAGKLPKLPNRLTKVGKFKKH